MYRVLDIVFHIQALNFVKTQPQLQVNDQLISTQYNLQLVRRLDTVVTRGGNNALFSKSNYVGKWI